MSTITAILEPDVDGTLHVPVPAELRHRKCRVEVKLEAAELPAQDDLEETEKLRAEAMQAFKRLREANPYFEIADPVAWQREIRTDRILPFR